MRSGLLTFIGLKVIHVDFYVIGFLSVVKAPWVNRRFTGSPRRGPWVGNFFKGLYMYIYTDVALQLNPHPPCSSVHYCSVVHYCTSVHLVLRAIDCRSPVAWRVFLFQEDGICSHDYHSRGRCFASSGMGLRWKTFKSFFNIYLTAFDLAALIGFHS